MAARNIIDRDFRPRHHYNAQSDLNLTGGGQLLTRMCSPDSLEKVEDLMCYTAKDSSYSTCALGYCAVWSHDFQGGTDIVMRWHPPTATDLARQIWGRRREFESER